jgi:hypothetical protein
MQEKSVLKSDGLDGYHTVYSETHNIVLFFELCMIFGNDSLLITADSVRVSKKIDIKELEKALVYITLKKPVKYQLGESNG